MQGLLTRFLIIGVVILCLPILMLIASSGPLGPLGVYIWAALAIALAIGAISYTFLERKLQASSVERELKPLFDERTEITSRMREAHQGDVIDTIRLGLNQLTEYYVINKSQAKSSFNLSLFAIVLGLITIISSITLFYVQQEQHIQLVTITSVSGALLEFIGGAYFVVYRKSIMQMNLYFNQLIKMQDTMLAVKLTQDMANRDKQTDLAERIILTLLARGGSEFVVNPDRSPNKATKVERDSEDVVNPDHSPSKATNKQNHDSHIISQQHKINYPEL